MIISELSKEKHKNKVVADFGCGEGRLELELKEAGHEGKIYSFDAGKLDSAPHVLQFDVANLPLETHSVDAGVFCLALMGTNYHDFVLEANRVLKKDGLLLVAEVVSRISDTHKFFNFLNSGGF